MQVQGMQVQAEASSCNSRINNIHRNKSQGIFRQKVQQVSAQTKRRVLEPKPQQHRASSKASVIEAAANGVQEEAGAKLLHQARMRLLKRLQGVDRTSCSPRS